MNGKFGVTSPVPSVARAEKGAIATEATAIAFATSDLGTTDIM